MKSDLPSPEVGEGSESEMAYSSSSLALPRRLILGLPLLGMPLSLAACSSESLLNATFDTEALGSPPAAAQPAGTVSLSTGAGTVTVEPSPTPSATDQWVQMTSAGFNPTLGPTALQCNFARFGGDGEYTITVSLCIPFAQALSLQFEPFGQSATTFLNFLRIDFVGATVRINGETSESLRLTGKLSSVFSVIITMTIGASGANARISLVGEASGGQDVTVSPSLLGVAREFGALKVFLDAHALGPVYIQGASVLRTIP